MLQRCSALLGSCLSREAPCATPDCRSSGRHRSRPWWSGHAHGRCPSGLKVEPEPIQSGSSSEPPGLFALAVTELFCKERTQDIDSLRTQRPSRRNPMDCTGWELPVRQDSVQRTDREILAHKEVRQHSNSESRSQKRQDRIAIIGPETPC